MLTRERLLEYFDFSEAEGVLRWKRPTSVRVKVGDVAGKSGVVRLLGKAYTVAHLRCLLQNGVMPRAGIMESAVPASLDGEEWRAVNGFPGYEVSNAGRVRSLPRAVQQKSGSVRVFPGKLLTAGPNVRTGYPQVTLYEMGQGCRWKNVHELVAAAFLPDRPDGAEVRHRDGSRDNSAASNLEWGEHIDNMRDQYRHGTRIASEWHPLSVLTVELVQWIRESTQSGAAIARSLGISISTVCRARKGKTYAALTRSDLAGLEPQ